MDVLIHSLLLVSTKGSLPVLDYHHHHEVILVLSLLLILMLSHEAVSLCRALRKKIYIYNLYDINIYSDVFRDETCFFLYRLVF